MSAADDDQWLLDAVGPFSRLLGFRLLAAGDGRAEMEARPTGEHANGGGIVHGGYLSALLDSATGWAVHSALPEGTRAPHIQLTIQYLRMALIDQPLACTARAVAAGRRVAAAEAEITQNGAVVARGVTSHAVLSELRAP
jgi:acyl-CoA thioesterase